MTTVAYGSDADQVGDLLLPTASSAPIVCLFHGGFWRMPYGRDELAPIAEDLAGAGFVVWNLEYRRVGPGGHAWPATFEDIDAVLAHLPRLAKAERQIDLARLAFVGHSAGGHLAFLAAATAARSAAIARPSVVVGLAPILDLVAADAAGLGGQAVAALIGGHAAQLPDRYAEASPRALLPLHVRQFILHGDTDAAVPVHLSRDYAAAARQAGDDVTCTVLRDADHMAFVDPSSDAHHAVRRLLLETL